MERLPHQDPNKRIWVCASCFQASCWHYIFLCDDYLHADIVQKSIAELEALDLEHPCYWDLEEQYR